MTLNRYLILRCYSLTSQALQEATEAINVDSCEAQMRGFYSSLGVFDLSLILLPRQRSSRQLCQRSDRVTKLVPSLPSGSLKVLHSSSKIMTRQKVSDSRLTKY